MSAEPREDLWALDSDSGALAPHRDVKAVSKQRIGAVGSSLSSAIQRGHWPRSVGYENELQQMDAERCPR